MDKHGALTGGEADWGSRTSASVISEELKQFSTYWGKNIESVSVDIKQV